MNKILIFMFVLHLGCGTNTGNPGVSPVSSPASTSAELISTVCARVASCYAGAESSVCSSQVLSIAGYPSQLGVNAANYSTMSQLNAAILSGAVSVNTTKLQSCQATISQLSCSNALITQSYSTSTPSDYSSTNVLFQSSSTCSQIY